MSIDKKTVTVIVLTICFILSGSVYSFFRKQNQQKTIIYETASLNETSLDEVEIKKSVKIYVTGAVNNPGTYELSEDSRVEDAIAAAGGTTDEADLNKINLAAYIKDAQQINVPDENDTAISQSYEGESVLININLATADELVKLPQVGPVIAENIIRYREESGGFQTIEDIKNVSRIGDKTFEEIKNFITVD